MDFHNHVMPGVDDGASDLGEGVAALEAFRDEGVGTVVATPHFRASRTERPGPLTARLEFMDGAFERLVREAERRGLDLRLERGAEIRLDAPEPDLADPRLRLAGTHFVLVEFQTFQMPPYGAEQLAGIREAGWVPVLAHPERYAGVADRLDVAQRWRERAYFQVNAGSLQGRYGSAARRAARAFFERGWVDYVSSDFHARGAPGLRETHDLLLEAETAEPGRTDARARPTGPDADPRRTDGDDGRRPAGADDDRTDPAADPVSEGEEGDLSVARLLTEANPRRLLENREPLPVPGLAFEGGFVERLKGWLR